MAGRIEILGIYRLPITEALVKEAIETQYGEDLSPEELAIADKQARTQLQSVVLVEAMVFDADDSFDVGDFQQPDSDQAAYDEHFLHENGITAYDSWEPPSDAVFRVTFFYHYYDSSKPFLTSYGMVKCPDVQDMPERLKELSPYEPCD